MTEVGPGHVKVRSEYPINAQPGLFQDYFAYRRSVYELSRGDHICLSPVPNLFRKSIHLGKDKVTVETGEASLHICLLAPGVLRVRPMLPCAYDLRELRMTVNSCYTTAHLCLGLYLPSRGTYSNYL